MKLNKFEKFSAYPIIRRHLKTSLPFLNARKIFNIAMSKFEEKTGKTVLSSKPFFIKIEPTNLCNLKCKGCFHSEEKRTLEKMNMLGDMDFEMFKGIIGGLDKYLVKVSLYSMGEPLLCGNIVKMVQYLTEKRIASVISSNLNYLTPELAEGLVRAKLTHLIISLDGYDEKSYLSYREGGDFNKLLENIKLIQEKKRKAGSKYPQIEIQSIHFKEYAEKDIKKIKALAAGLKPDVFTLRDDYSIYLGDRDKVKAKRCFWLYGHPMFRFDGVVQPCCFYYLDEKNNFGNVKDMEAEKIWNNEKFKKAREYFNAGKASGELKCESCDYFKYESQ